MPIKLVYIGKIPMSQPAIWAIEHLMQKSSLQNELYAKNEKAVKKIEISIPIFQFLYIVGSQNGHWLNWEPVITSLPLGIASMLFVTEPSYGRVLCVERVSRCRNHRTWRCCIVRSWSRRLSRKCRSRPWSSCLSASVKDEEVSS